MKSNCAATGMLAFLAATLACGGERSPATSALQTQRDALLAVTNEHYLDATIFALRSGSRHRIGTVSGFKTDTIPLRGAIVGSGTVRLLVEPIGSSQVHVTEPIPIGANEWIELKIRNPLNLSSFTVSYRTE